jgi:cell division protein FtsL
MPSEISKTAKEIEMEILPGKKKAYYFNIVAAAAITASLTGFGSYETVKINNEIVYNQHHMPSEQQLIPALQQEFKASCRDSVIYDNAQDFEKKAASALGQNQTSVSVTTTIDPSQIESCAHQQAVEQYESDKMNAQRGPLGPDCFFGGLTASMFLLSLMNFKFARARYGMPEAKPNAGPT